MNISIIILILTIISYMDYQKIKQLEKRLNELEERMGYTGEE